MATPHFAKIDRGSLSSVLVDFVKEFNTFLGYHEELEGEEASLSEYLFKVGTQVKEGKETWTKSDLNDILRWRKLQPLRRRIEQGSVNLEKQLRFALTQPEHEDRLTTMCRIPGFGPVLACAVLTLTWPETYGILGNPSWRALRVLGFDLPSKPYSGGGFTVAEALQYQDILKTLGRMTTALPVQVADALHAFYKIKASQSYFVAG
ncbi:MAG: hypothetical protein ABSD49_12580 [Candidatus Bathyarchaeia archaeon]|jgi:hypothetical protein